MANEDDVGGKKYNMEFGLALTTNLDLRKSNLITEFSDDLAAFFKYKGYGEGVKSFTIGIVCVDQEFEQFFKYKKPKYTKGIRLTNPDGIRVSLEDCLEYSIKFDFETFRNSGEIEAKKTLASQILESLHVLDEMKSKIKDFDAISFKREMKEYFKEKGFI